MKFPLIAHHQMMTTVMERLHHHIYPKNFVSWDAKQSTSASTSVQVATRSKPIQAARVIQHLDKMEKHQVERENKEYISREAMHMHRDKMALFTEFLGIICKK